MKHIQQLKEDFQNQLYQERLSEIYLDFSQISYQTNRYIQALDTYESIFGADQVSIFSAPGRSEIGGNHTDHQHGAVLAAAINLDAIAIVKPLEEPLIRIKSDDYDLITISLTDLDKCPEEAGTTTALIKGVLAGFKERNYAIGGFQAYITSDVLIGAGLSSSAAFETIIGTILSGLYNGMTISPIEIAIIGQYAENEYFGKPCGLMDQMACSVGSLVNIDFENPAKPVVNRVDYDFASQGYSLCIVDTKGSHEDLTPDYAAIPAEMRQVAACFGKEYLREVTKEELFANLSRVREATSDRATLRAIHFIEDHTRVGLEVQALQENDFPRFLELVQASGHSSFEYLQNVYTNRDVAHQNVSLALAVSTSVLGNNGVCRVHGGGFAGTIQAFVKDSAVAEYQAAMDGLFGEGACKVLKIRKFGGMQVL